MPDAAFINHAEPGCSNSRIIRTTVEYLISLPKDTDWSSVFVVLGFTEVTRTEFYSLSNSSYISFLRHIRPNTYKARNYNGLGIIQVLHDYYYTYFSNPIEMEKLFFIQLIQFKSLLKNLGIRYLFTFSVNPHRDPVSVSAGLDNNLFVKELEIFRSRLDRKRVIFYNFMQFTKDNKYSITKCNHPGADAHAAWADYVLEYIRQNEIY